MRFNDGIAWYNWDLHRELNEKLGLKIVGSLDNHRIHRNGKSVKLPLCFDRNLDSDEVFLIMLMLKEFLVE